MHFTKTSNLGHDVPCPKGVSRNEMLASFLAKVECFGASGMNTDPSRPNSMHALDELAHRRAGEEALTPAEMCKLCDSGDASACLTAGLMLMEGTGGFTQNPHAAADVLRKGCAAKNSNACFFLGRLYDGFVGADGRGLPRNSSEAGKHFRDSCTGKVGEGCYNFAQMLDQGRMVGEPEANKEKRVAKFFALACSHGVGKGCVNAGVMQLDGSGVRADAAAALRSFQAACMLGEGSGCGFAGNLLIQGGKAEDSSHAAELFYAGCRFGNAKSCMAQARMLSKAAAEAVETGAATGEHALHAKARAVMFYRRACELADAEGCKKFFASKDGLKMIDTRSESEKEWLNVTPPVEDDQIPRAPK